MDKHLAGKVCLVTGGTRGIGRGIAVQLGEAGATVYVTGRTLKHKTGEVAGSLEDTANEVESRGGKCIPVVVDHSKDEEVEALFKKIEREQDGQLDILVNNAYSAVTAISENIGVPFWEQNTTMWDTVNQVGLRNHYLCTVYASRMMAARKTGLIVIISSFGGLVYFVNVPYGIGKQANDRMAADCAVELRPHNVCVVSMWPGVVQTEVIMDSFKNGKFPEREYYQPGVGKITTEQMIATFQHGESCEYTGKAIVKLAQDKGIMKKSGRVLLVGELANEYGFTDIDGRVIPGPRSVKFLLQSAGWRRLASCVPAWIKIPYFAMTLSGSKF